MNPLRMKNPYRDVYTGPGYLEVYDRHLNYAKNYDNDERDQDRTVGVVDIFDNSGDAAVGRDLVFRANPGQGWTFSQRSNGSEPHFSKLLKLSFQEEAGQVEVTQYADGDGDGRAEVHRTTLIEKSSGRITSMTDHLSSIQ